MYAKIISTFFIAILFIGIQSCNSQSAKSDAVKLLSVTDFAQKVQTLGDKATILDVRTPGEYSEGHLANATLVDWNGSSFEADAAKLDKTKAICVYCAKGGRSASACAKLASMGFTEIYDMKGGITAWKAEGKDVINK